MSTRMSATSVVAVLMISVTSVRAQGPTPTSSAAVDSLAVHAGTAFIRQLAAGAYDSAASAVDAAVPAGAMSADALRRIWTQLTQQIGSLEALTDPRVTDRDSFRIVDLAARFARQPLVVRVVLTAAGRVSGLWFDQPPPPAYHPPDYVDTTKFTERDVTVGHPPLSLPGTLVLPRLPGRLPAAVLVHGSGPNDRDEAIGGTRVFRDLAWGLATRGVVVLRYDKRTRVHPVDAHHITVDAEVLDDVHEALMLLRAQPEVDPARVFVIGHSEGATLGPEIASRDGHLAGLVMLAPSARPLSEIAAAQIRYVSSAATSESDTAGTQMTQLLETLHQLTAHSLPPDSLVLGAPVRYWDELDALRPVDRARQIRTRLLILHGARDYQVTADDLALWRQGLRNRRDVMIKDYPNLNHLFVAGTGPSTPAEYEREGHVDAEVIADVGAFCGR